MGYMPVVCPATRLSWMRQAGEPMGQAFLLSSKSGNASVDLSLANLASYKAPVKLPLYTKKFDRTPCNLMPPELEAERSCKERRTRSKAPVAACHERGDVPRSRAPGSSSSSRSFSNRYCAVP